MLSHSHRGIFWSLGLGLLGVVAVGCVNRSQDASSDLSPRPSDVKVAIECALGSVSVQNIVQSARPIRVVAIVDEFDESGFVMVGIFEEQSDHMTRLVTMRVDPAARRVWREDNNGSGEGVWVLEKPSDTQ